MNSRVPREYLLAVVSGRIAVVGIKVFKLSPLSIDSWHASTFESGISPFCLQICFCINTSFATLGGTKSINKINMATADLDTKNVIAVTEADLGDEQK